MCIIITNYTQTIYKPIHIENILDICFKVNTFQLIIGLFFFFFFFFFFLSIYKLKCGEKFVQENVMAKH